MAYHKKASQIIDLYRFPLAVLVVFIHYVGYGNLEISASSFYELSSYDVYTLIRTFISRVISQIAVPAFFLISGYLFFQRLEVWDWKIWREKVIKRIHTLLIPYILWSTLYVIYGRVLYIIKEGIWDWKSIIEIIFSKWFIIGTYYNCILNDTTNLSWIGTANPTCCPIFIPFWFIRDLIFMVVLSPLLYLAVKKLRGGFVLVLLFAYVSQIWPVIPGISIRAICFFSLGGYLAMNVCNIPRQIIKASYVSTIVIAILCTFYYHSYLYSFLLPWFVLSACFTLWDIGGYFVMNNISVPQFLIKATFFVFAFHFFLIDLWNVYPLFNGHSLIGMLLSYFIVPLIMVCFSVGLYYLLDKGCPKLTRILVGR